MVKKLYYLDLDKYVNYGGVVSGSWEVNEPDLDESLTGKVHITYTLQILSDTISSDCSLF